MPSWATGDAVVSECQRYRYTLTRAWGSGARALFVMLNPSTADAAKDDATIRKCMGFAERWGLSGIGVANLYAWRARSPADLWAAKSTERVGPENERHMHRLLNDRATYSVVVAAWGAQVTSASGKSAGAARRADEIAELLGGYNGQCLGLTKDGDPRHPLMLPYAARLLSMRGCDA